MIVNTMMARQELSHQQIMSYIIGGGDHYMSHCSRSLNWGDINKWMSVAEDNDNVEAATSNDIDTTQNATQTDHNMNH
jgi:hypothetical protein